MSTATTLSRVTGFVRMWATGFALGVTAVASAYNVANNIPNMVFELIAGGILSSLFIPTFMELRAGKTEDDAWRFASHVFNLSVLALGVVAVIGTAFPEPFIWTQTFMMSPAEAATVRPVAEAFFRFFAIQVVVYGGGMVVQGLLNSQRKYLWTALGPVFNNVVVIVTMFAVAAIAPRSTDTAFIVLAAGTTLGVFVMFAVMVPQLLRGEFRYTPELGLKDPAVRRMLVLAGPTILYVVTNLVAVSFRNASAFSVSDNGPSILMFAWTFYQLPYGILAVALATAVFTELSESAGRKDHAEFKKFFRQGLSTTGVLILPSAAMLVALAEPLVSIYQVGRFTAGDVPPVAGALRLWALALVFYASSMFVLRTFYSLKDTRTPMFANLALTAVQIGLYVVLTGGLRSWAGLGINGIPLADAAFYALLFATLLVLLNRRIGGFSGKAIMVTYAKMTLAAVVGGGAAWGVSQLLAPVGDGVAGALIQVAGAGVVGLIVSFGIGRVLGVEEVRAVGALTARLTRRIRPHNKER